MFGWLAGLIGKRRVSASLDFGRATRRLAAIPSTTREINSLIRSYGRSALARSRYLCINNPYAAAAKDAFQAALVGDGIKPSSLIKDIGQKAALQMLWLDSTDEMDANGETDFYGLQTEIAAELFEAGECFVRVRPRRPSDGLLVPLQFQILPSEMLPYDYSLTSKNANIKMGIEFDAIGRRIAYHFLREHPGADTALIYAASMFTRVPASEIYHIYMPFRTGQLRGVPHTISAMTTLAMLDLYDDAELERKRTTSLFAAFIRRPKSDDDDHPLGVPLTGTSQTAPQFGMEPGAMIDLEPGEDVSFANPADVGQQYEAFQTRMLMRISAGMGIPYATMTGDLRQVNYSSIRAGMVEFKRRIRATQNHVMIYQFCRPAWRRWLETAAATDALPWSFGEHQADSRNLSRVRWIPPHWDWVDPYKDLQAEALAVKEKFKSRSDVIESSGYDAEEIDARIAADREREQQMGLAANPPAEEDNQNA